MGDLSINVVDRVSVLSDIDLAARLTDTEDHFTERKSKSDKGGWLRTTVAFANSTPIPVSPICWRRERRNRHR
jgi:hypothetical protein